MTLLLFEHLPGCSPLEPCASCEATIFLRGKLTPEDFNQFVDIMRGAGVKSSTTTPLDTLITTIDFSVRTHGLLRNLNIQTVGDLVQKTEAELLRSPNFGRKSLNEIKEVLAGLSLHLSMPPPAVSD